MFFLAAAIVAVHAQPAVPQKAADEVERLQKSIETLTDLATNEDRGIPRRVLQRAQAVIVIPSLVKGGFVVGAKHGRGVMSLRSAEADKGGWSAPAFVTITGGSIGWQIGVESVDLVLLAMSQRSVEGLLSDKFTIGGALSAAAGPTGRSADAQSDAKMNGGLLAYSRASGLFAGATLEGATFHADKDANESFYGQAMSIRAIAGPDVSKTHPPSIAETWRNTLRDLTRSEPARSRR
jgi:lipid-binding SYLF domain-containing protein